MTYGPRPGPGTWLVIGIASICLVLPVLWVAAAPGLSRPAVDQAARGDPAVLHAPTAPARVTDGLDRLPIFVGDLPDQPSRLAADAYARLRAGDVAAGLELFAAAWNGLVVGPEAAPQLASVRARLLTPAAVAAGSPRPAYDMGTFLATVRPALAALGRDPRNGDRLANAAVALFTAGVSQAQDPAAGDPTLDLVQRARWLLQAASAAFPESRAAHLDWAYVTSVNQQACTSVEQLRTSALDIAGAWLGSHPADLTARLLVSSLQSRDQAGLASSPSFESADRTRGLGDAIETLRPLLDSPATNAVGQAALGDAYAAAASAVGDQAPHLSLAYAGQAAAAYERALAVAGDPGLFAALAAALDLTGQHRAALHAQERAVGLAPASPELQIGLALEQERQGAFPQMLAAAERALSLSLAGDVLARDARHVLHYHGLAGDRDFLGSSIGSERPRLVVPASAPDSGATGCGGGGFAAIADPIPPLVDPLADEHLRWDPLPDASLTLALAASVVLSDPAGAGRDLDRWEQRLGALPPQERSLRVKPMAAAAAGDASFALPWLRHAAARSGASALLTRVIGLCRAAEPTAGDAKQCEAEAAFHAGDVARAAGLLREVVRERVATFGRDGGTLVDQPVIEAAYATWLSGDLQQADRLLQQVLDHAGSGGGTQMLAGALLGELLLDEGQPGAAARYLQEAAGEASAELDRIRGERIDPLTAKEAMSVDRAILQHADNEQGLALLWQAQPASDGPLACRDPQARCSEAREDIVAALAIDPDDPLAQMNLGWADRALGHADAARDDLEAALRGDPSLYPALNDLGWLAADGNRRSTARLALERALSVEPDDDLAAWNLGVLLLSSGPSEIPRGEAYLARAIRLRPELRELPLAYRSDERVYRQMGGSYVVRPATRPLGERLGDGILATGIVSTGSTLVLVSGFQIEHYLTGLLEQRRLPGAGVLAGLRRRRAGRAAPSRRRRALASLVRAGLTAALLGAITAWTVLPGSGAAAPAIVVTGLVGAGLAVLVHEAALLAAACVARVRFRPVWPGAASAVSVALLPFGVAEGPFPGHEALPATPFRHARWVYLAGIAANLAAAGLLCGLYLGQPLPALRLFAELQLGAAAFASLPLRPMDGAPFRNHPRDSLLLLPLALIAALGGFAFHARLL